MKIEKYSFGKMVIKGETYTSDLMIIGNRIYSNWRRKAGHFLDENDIQEILEYPMSSLFIGTGAFGRMKIDPKLINLLEKLGLSCLYSGKTDDAVIEFNKNNNSNKCGLFHLTC